MHKNGNEFPCQPEAKRLKSEAEVEFASRMLLNIEHGFFTFMLFSIWVISFHHESLHSLQAEANAAAKAEAAAAVAVSSSGLLLNAKRCSAAHVGWFGTEAHQRRAARRAASERRARLCALKQEICREKPHGEMGKKRRRTYRKSRTLLQQRSEKSI